MASIGTVTKTNQGGFSGFLYTLDAKIRIDITPVDAGDNPHRPDFRIIAQSGLELGAGWTRHSRSGQAYVSLTMAAPQLPRLYANLVPDQVKADTYVLLWNPEG